MPPLPAGKAAPDFTLPSAPDKMLTLSSLRGRPVILAFYPADWSPVCGEQVVLYNEVLPEFQQYGAELLGISVDSAWCHKAFAENRHLVSRAYGAYVDKRGFSARALFVIDAAGLIHWSYESPLQTNPGADGILSALESLPGDSHEHAPAPAGR